MRALLDKVGSIGAVVAAAACPICFPKLAIIGALVGLGGLAAYEAQLFIAAQALVAVAILGHMISYRQHRRRWRLATAITAGAAFFLGLYALGSEWLAYAGLAGLMASSIPSLDSRFKLRAAPAVARDSVITCPKWGHQQSETMPTDACLFFYDCKGCSALLRPKQGDCCVFCSYGTVKCPPKQAAACCAA